MSINKINKMEIGGIVARKSKNYPLSIKYTPREGKPDSETLMFNIKQPNGKSYMGEEKYRLLPCIAFGLTAQEVFAAYSPAEDGPLVVVTGMYECKPYKDKKDPTKWHKDPVCIVSGITVNRDPAWTHKPPSEGMRTIDDLDKYEEPKVDIEEAPMGEDDV